MAANWIDKGGYYSFDRLSAKMRFATQPYMPLKQFVRDEPVIGSKAGDTVNIPKAYNLTRAYPTSALSETSPMTETDWTAGTTSVTISEWGDAVPFTEKFMRLSDFDPQDITSKLLMHSMAKNQNYLIITELKKTGLKYAATGTAGTAPTRGVPATWGADPGTWARSLEAWDLRQLRADAMDTYGIPPLTGEVSEFAQYALVGSQGIMNCFLADSTVQSAINASWTSAGRDNPLLRGSIGIYNGVLLILDTSGLLGGLQDTNYSGEAVFFGDDAVVSATALYPEIRVKTPEDYGRDRGIAWYGLYGYRLVGGDAEAEWTAGHARAIHLTSSAT